jgi:hypothetical protein
VDDHRLGRAGPLGKSGGPSVGKGGRVMWKPDTSKVVAPTCVD